MDWPMHALFRPLLNLGPRRVPNRPGTGNRFDFRPGKPPQGGKREQARRLRQMARKAAKAAAYAGLRP